ncbi:MAG TPA: YbfB/YjiJ family MFS transporter [Stellaceae bacterium]|nr:YbfB/YjiJ family MFS transporter [Stellaceae bacterium]
MRATIAALAASLVGVGLARFGYTPLIPVLIAAGWFSPAAAVYLGAANLAGYLAGALAAGRIAPRAGTAATLRGAMALTAASLVACAFPLGFAWFFPWRFLSGVTGGVLMALAAPTAMAAIPPARRGIAGGAIFTGVGLGIAASGTLVPLLARVGLTETWLGLGALALALTAIAWGGWPASPPRAPAPLRSSSGKRAGSPMLLALYLEYALNAVGLVPHMIFLVDFIARGLGRGVAAGGHYWVLFGIGALIGPMLAGHLGDRIGFRAALRLAFVIEAAAVAAPLVSVGAPSLELSTFVVGAFVPGIVAITIGRARELVGLDPAAYVAAWGRCTIAFAIGQAAAGYGFSYIFARVEHGYPVLFAIAAAALLAALAVDVAVAGALRRATRPHRAVGG